MIHAPVTTATNLLLGVQCAAYTFALRGRASPHRRMWSVFFLAMAVATSAGVVKHGYGHLVPGAVLFASLWLSNAASGISTWAAQRATLAGDRGSASAWGLSLRRCTDLQLVAFLTTNLFAGPRMTLLIVNTALGLAPVIVVEAVRARRGIAGGAGIAGGLLLSLATGAVYLARWSPGGGLTHNDLAHVLMGASFHLIFLGVRSRGHSRSEIPRSPRPPARQAGRAHPNRAPNPGCPSSTSPFVRTGAVLPPSPRLSSVIGPSRTSCPVHTPRTRGRPSVPPPTFLGRGRATSGGTHVKSHHRLWLLLMALTLPACAGDSAAPIGSVVSGHDNPLLAQWETEFGVPPFDLIENEHYLPAMREAMALEKADIEAIVANPEPPTFANTIEALERSGALYTRASRVFGAVSGAHTNDTLREVERTLAPEQAAHSDDISLNPVLWERVKTVYDARDQLELTPEQLMLLEETHKGFVRRGASLDDDAKTRMREINKELAELSQKFSENVLDETNAYELHVTDTVDLGDLPASLVELAAAEAQRRGHESGWSFTLQRPSINPFLESSPNRELRKAIFLGYAMRGDNDNDKDNKAALSRMAALRAERAHLLGYPSHAAFVLSDNMAETPERVMGLLDQVWTPALAVAKQERSDMQAVMNAEGVSGKLEGWDWRHYTEKVRREKYALDQQALLPYFEVNAVRDGVFMVATNLYGLTFHQRDDLPRWHPTQQVFEVREADGSHLGMLYMDFFARPSKQGGAWMNSLQKQGRLDGEKHPIVTTNFNFPAPTAEGVSLISFTDALTLAHECGHALHGLLSNVTYESLGGTSVARDFVEFGSQIMENWMSEPEVLRMYAKHYQTGEVIPDELVDKLQASATFGQGFITAEFVAAAYLDMAWHTQTQAVEQDARAFEAAEMARIGLIEEIIPRYRSTYYSHIFAGGYSAGYYAYLWAEVLDKDAFQAFVECGDLFDPDTALRLREEILSRGGTRPGMELFRAFRGREPSIDALLAARGLK